MSKIIKLSVVIPAYNETWEIKKNTIDAVDDYLSKQKYLYEVLIVDDESTNNTLEKVKEYIKDKSNFSVIANKHGGKAVTVMTGITKSQGVIVLFTDMDQATPIDQIEKMFPKFDEGYDIVIGKRKGRKGAPVIRKLMAFGFTLLRNIVLGLPLTDTQCGFKAFNKKPKEAIFPQLLEQWKAKRKKGVAVNAGFDVETLFLAKKLGFKIAEVEVLWHHVQNERQVQVFKDSIEAIKDIFRIKFNDIRGKYKLVPKG